MKEYKTLATSVYNIDKIVNKHLRDGWELFGNPFHLQDDCIVQVIVRNFVDEEDDDE